MNNKAVLSGKEVAKHIETPPKIDIEPNGVEIGINEIKKIDIDGVITVDEDERTIDPKKEDVTKDVKKEYKKGKFFNILGKGLYEVRLRNKVTIPENTVGMIFPRSTLNRYGICMHQTAIWDSGYSGYGTLTVDIKPKTLKIQEDEKWFQLMLIKADSAGKTYDGHWQHENID